MGGGGRGEGEGGERREREEGGGGGRREEGLASDSTVTISCTPLLHAWEELNLRWMILNLI